MLTKMGKSLLEEFMGNLGEREKKNSENLGEKNNPKRDTSE